MTLSEVTAQRRMGAIWIIAVLTTLSSVLAGTATAGPSKVQTITPPYEEFQGQQDDCDDPLQDGCNDDCENPAIDFCDERGLGSTQGVLRTVAELRDQNSCCLESEPGVASAWALVRDGFQIPGKSKGGTVGVEITVEFLEAPHASASAGENAQVVLNALVSTACVDCIAEEEIVLADNSGLVACSPSPESPCTQVIELSIQAPADQTLGDGTVQVRLSSRAELVRQASVPFRVHSARAYGRVRVAGIVVRRN